MKPLVFVPGFPGSTLIDAADGRELFPNIFGLLSPTVKPLILPRLEGPDPPDRQDGVVAGEPIAELVRLHSLVDLAGLDKQAESLYEILRDLGYRDAPGGSHMRAVGWDWRRPVDHRPTLDALQTAIDDLHRTTGQRVTALVHSTGGLVLRSLVEARPAVADRLERVIAFGVPWAGLLKAFRSLLGQSAFVPLNAAETARVVRRAWAAYDLLPPDPAKAPTAPALFMIPAARPNEFVQSSPLIDLRWLPGGSDAAAMRTRAASADERLGQRAPSFRLLPGTRLPVVNIVGFGLPTITQYRLEPHGDGMRPVEVESDEGDSTVPARSAAWLQGTDVTTFLVPLGHTTNSQITRPHSLLWLAEGARELLTGLLTGRAMPEHAWAAVDSFTASAGADVLVRFAVFDRSGRARPGAFATARGLNGGDGGRVLLGADGRGTMRIPRALIRRVPGTGLRRFELGLHWTGGAAPDRKHPMVTS